MSKKAKTSAPTGEVEPEKAPEDLDNNLDNLMDDFVPPKPTINANPPEADPAIHEDTSSPHAMPASPVADPLKSSANPPSPIKPSEPSTEEVLITSTGFQELGNPISLAKHSAKEELIEKRKVKFDMANYSHLSISEILSSYLSQVHTSRDLEIDMVKHMHQKYEV